MREEDAHAIAARLGSYERTYSTEVPRFRSVGRQSEEIMPKPAKKVWCPYRISAVPVFCIGSIPWSCTPLPVIESTDRRMSLQVPALLREGPMA